MVNFLTINCILATWLVLFASNANHNPNAQLQPPAPAAGGPVAGGPGAGGPAAADCGSLVYKMADCLEFLTGSDRKPEASCCSGFKQVLNIDAKCICEGFKSAADMGLNINMKKAATLPSLCGVSAPPISSCNMSNSPGASPVNPPQVAPPPKSPKPPARTLPPTSSPSPSAPSISSGSPAPANQAPAPAPVAQSGAYATYSSFLAPLTMIIAVSMTLGII